MATASALLLLSLLFSSQCHAAPKSSTAFGNATSASSASTLVVTATTGRHAIVTYQARRVTQTSLWSLTSTTTTSAADASSTQTIYPSGFTWAPPSPSPSGALPAIPSNAPYAYVSHWNPSSLASLSATDSSSSSSLSSHAGQHSSGINGTSTPPSATSVSGLPTLSHNHTWPGPGQPPIGTGSLGTGLPWPLPSNGTVFPGTGGPRWTPSIPGSSNGTSAAGSAVTSIASGISSIISSITSANSTTESGRNSTKTRRPSSSTSSEQKTSSGSSGSSTGTSDSSITSRPTSTPTKPWGVETTSLSGSTWTLTFESTTATASTSFVESDSSTTTTVQVKSGDPIWSVPTPPAGFPVPVIPPPLIPPPVAPVPGVPPPCVFGCGGGGGGGNPGSGTDPSHTSPSSTGSSTDSISSSSSSTESCSSSSAVSSCMVIISLSTSFLSGGTSSSTVATNTTTSCTTVTACAPTTATTTVSTSASISGNYCSPGCAQCQAPAQTGAAKRSSGAEELLRRDVPDSRTTFNVEAIYRRIESRISSGQTINLKHGLTGILSTASKIDFSDAPKNLMVSGLVGCTSVAVVSQKGAWLSHMYEAPTFFGSQAQFQQQALDPLRSGGKDFESLSGLVGGDGIFSDLSQTKVFIMTPGTGGSPIYGDFVNQLRDALTGGGGPLSGVSVAQHVYTKPSDPNAPLRSDYDGKALIMYDNNQINEPNAPKGSNPVPLPKPQAIWQVYMEDQRMDQDMWDPASSQACGANQKRQDGGSCTSAPTTGTTTGPVTTATSATNSSAIGSAVGTAIGSVISVASSLASAQSASSSSASAAAAASSAASAASSAVGSIASVVSSVASAAAAASSSAAPLPADCILFDTGLSYAVQVYGVTWDNDKGDALHKQEKGCGLLTSWSFDAACQGGGGIAWFELPYFIKSGCVERAIHSSGGPEGLHCGKGGDVDNVPNAAAPCFLPQGAPPPPGAVNAKVNLAVGHGEGGNVTLPDPQPWPISKSVAGPLTTTHELAAQTAAPQRRREKLF